MSKIAEDLIVGRYKFGNQEIGINSFPQFRERCPLTFSYREQIEYFKRADWIQSKLLGCFQQIVNAITQEKFYDTCDIFVDHEHQEMRIVFGIRVEHSLLCHQFTRDYLEILQPERIMRNVRLSGEALRCYVRNQGAEVGHQDMATHSDIQMGLPEDIQD